MSVPAWLIGLLLAVAVIGGAVAMKQYDETAEAREHLQLLAHHVVTTDTIFRTDSLYFTRKLKVAAGLHDTTILHLTDTVLVKTYIAMQDTVIKACTRVVNDCAARVATRDSIIAVYRSLKPSRIGLGLAAGCGVALNGQPTCALIGGVTWRVF
jgi:hypothetical protein